MFASRANQEDEESGPEYEEPYEPQEEVGKKVFEDEQGSPIYFFIHKSVKRKSSINNLRRDIEKHGGVVIQDDHGVDTVLIDEFYVNREHLQLSYEISFDELWSETWVEPMSFVQRCIREGSVRHRPRPRKGMGGSLRPYRVQFTQEDDENLARYLAHRIPESEAGGRRGNGVWQELEQAFATNPNTAPWAARHPWQSWRNRYNKDVQRFDRMIDHYVKTEKPTEKQRYRLDRRLVRGRRVQNVRDEEPEEHEKPLSPPPAKRRRVDDATVPVVEDVGENDRLALKGKGKERASDSAHETDDQLSDYRSLFGDDVPDEPGPSTRQRAQGVTYTNRGRRMQHSSPPPFSVEPQTSQVTLVASPPQLHGHRVHIQREHMLHPLPQHLERTITNPVHEPTLVEPRHVAEGDATDNVSHFPPASGAVSPVSHDQSRAQGITTRAAAALATASRQRQGVAIKKARRLKPPEPQVSGTSPPFRNTRSRSRSVEPTALPSRTKPRFKKKMVAEVDEIELPVLASLEEAPDEDDVRTLKSQEMGSTSAPARETLEDEMNVEDLLVNNISGRSQVTEGSARIDEADASPEAASSPAEATDDGMDSDDAQTDQILRHPPAEHVSQRPTSIFNIEPDGLRPDEMLRMFNEGLPAPSTTRSSRLSSVRPAALVRLRNDASARSRYSAASGSNRDPYEAEAPRAPANHRPPPQVSSASSVESFPIDGTKASAMKKRIQEMEKHTPYKPPRGTRAALFSQLRR